jgi:two-component system, OmpR family, response regulator
MAKILIVDDDAHIRELVGLYLVQSGYDVIEAEDGKQALQQLDETKVDLVVLDIMMPKVDGFTLCQEIRRLSSIPVLMLTALGETSQKVKGLKLGADDYLVKPFEPAELLARVHALLRRYRINTESFVEVGELCMNGTTRAASYHGQSMMLPPKEFDLLFKLASYPGRTLSRDQLIEEIWGYDFDGDERTIDVNIKRLRDKLPEADNSFRIRTVRGLGYRLEVDK